MGIFGRQHKGSEQGSQEPRFVPLDETDSRGSTPGSAMIRHDAPVFWHGDDYSQRATHVDGRGFGAEVPPSLDVRPGNFGPNSATVAIAYMALQNVRAQGGFPSNAFETMTLGGRTVPRAPLQGSRATGFVGNEGAQTYPLRQEAAPRDLNRKKRSRAPRNLALGSLVLLGLATGGAKYLGVGPFTGEGLRHDAAASAAEAPTREVPGEIATIENYLVATIPDGEMTITTEIQLDPTPGLGDDPEYPLSLAPPDNQLMVTAVTPELEFYVDVPVTADEKTAVRETTPEGQETGRRSIEINLANIAVRAVSNTEALRDTPGLPLFELTPAEMSAAFGDAVPLTEQTLARQKYEQRFIDIPNIATAHGVETVVSSSEFLAIVQEEVKKAMGIDNPDEFAVTYTEGSQLPDAKQVRTQFLEGTGSNLEFAGLVHDPENNSVPVVEFNITRPGN